MRIWVMTPRTLVSSAILSTCLATLLGAGDVRRRDEYSSGWVPSSDVDVFSCCVTSTLQSGVAWVVAFGEGKKYGIFLLVWFSSRVLGYSHCARLKKDVGALVMLFGITINTTVCVPTESCRAMVKTERFNKTLRRKPSEN
ncbi:hypothetical protein B0J18DRAFT_121053 [Chaetomium sp. MPI-SDFR-AT-0129]|nr:hypothetical protein B0J18DRAFT_121053 [Chaetomium sp. MPI-SDFR-AT-0129]